MKSQEVALAGRTEVTIVLQDDTELLEEVVVVGYGTQRKSDITGSVARISEEQMKQSIVTNADQMLQGKVAGVQVTQNSGAPGGATSVRIRGASSLNSSNEPLYVIDGVPMSGSNTIGGFDWAGGTNGQTTVNPPRSNRTLRHREHRRAQGRIGLCHLWCGRCQRCSTRDHTPRLGRPHQHHL